MSKELSTKPSPTCEMCRSSQPAHRKLNYTKGDGSTGRLLVCDSCAGAWKTEKGENGVWALTIRSPQNLSDGVKMVDRENSPSVMA